MKFPTPTPCPLHIAHMILDPTQQLPTPNTHFCSLALLLLLPPKCDLVSRPASFMLFPPQMMCLMLLLLCTTVHAVCTVQSMTLYNTVPGL